MSDEIISKEEPAKDEEPKYTDKQVNDLIAKNSAKEVEKFIRAQGLNSADDIKELLELKKSKMTDDEKKEARIKELESEKTETATRAERAEAKAEALASGVKADKVDRFIKLAMSGDYEGETVSEKIKNVLADFPEFIAESAPAFGKESGGDKLNATDEILQKARKAAGLTK